jgi:pimeloyl-ACP methyl ester carboxylesterase
MKPGEMPSVPSRMLVEMMAARNAGAKTAERLRGEGEQLGARRQHDVSGRLGRIRCPTFVASGRYDGIAPLPNGEWIAAHIRGAALHVYEGGHAFFIQDTRALPEIAAFLSGQTDAPARA